MCSHSQSILLFPTKENLAIYYLRSLCLCAFTTLTVALCLCRKASCGPASVFWLPGYGGLRRDECPDELSSVLYRLGINCQD